MAISLLYITAAGRAAALGLARRLVEERLVACANVLDGATSVYWWEGAVQEESEAVLIAKTPSANVPAVIARVKDLHDYACPCVVALPIGAGNPDFLLWVERETNSIPEA